MLKLQTDLNLIDRFDSTVIAAGSGYDILTSGYQGMWATPAATGWDLAQQGEHPAYLIWTEGNYDGTTESIGFTPDATNTTKLTFLGGKFRIKTNMFTGTPTAGQPLQVGATGGKLTVVSDVETLASGLVAHCLETTDADGYITIQTL